MSKSIFELPPLEEKHSTAPPLPLPGALVWDVCSMFDPSQVASMIQRHKGDGSRRRQTIRRLVYGSLPVVGPAGLKLSRGARRKIQNKSALRRLDLGEEFFSVSSSACQHGGRREAERSSDCQFCLSKQHKGRTSGQSADKRLACHTLRVSSHKLGFGASNGVKAVQLLLDSWTRSVQLFRTTVPSLASS